MDDNSCPIKQLSMRRWEYQFLFPSKFFLLRFIQKGNLNKQSRNPIFKLRMAIYGLYQFVRELSYFYSTWDTRTLNVENQRDLRIRGEKRVGSESSRDNRMNEAIC